MNGIINFDHLSILIFSSLLIFFLSGLNISSFKINNKIQLTAEKIIVILLILSSIWLYFPIIKGFVRVPNLNTIFTYSLFITLLIISLYKIKFSKNILLLLAPFFLLNQSIFFTHSDGVLKNYQESLKIVKMVNKKQNFKNIIFDDNDVAAYFRRYSNKFHSLNMFVSEHLIEKNIISNVLISSQYERSDDNDSSILVRLIPNNIFITDNIDSHLQNRIDFHSIKIFNNHISFDYTLNQIHYYRN